MHRLVFLLFATFLFGMSADATAERPRLSLGEHDLCVGSALGALAKSSSDTFLLMGHNFGLLGGPEHAPRFLDTLHRLSRPGATIIGTGRDPFTTDDPDNLAYHQRNRDRGRHPGQLVIRVRWRYLATPWFDYWFLPIHQMQRY